MLKIIYQEPEEIKNKTEFNKNVINEDVKPDSSIFDELNKPQNRLFIVGLVISSIISFLLWNVMNKFWKGKKEVVVTKDKKNR